MKVVTTRNELSASLKQEKQTGKTIGFVPTMGALHPGHASLVKRARDENQVVVVSIFVNPTQFNNTSDLDNYPKTLDADLKLLKSIGCDYVFVPSADEMYNSETNSPQIDLGFLEQVMEGSSRPGHFQGVVQIVYRLFELVRPDKAYFGLKDFQQVSVIRFMVKTFNLPVQIIPCETLRESSGLAMSSRNLRLTEMQKQDAVGIFSTLLHGKQLAQTSKPSEVKKDMELFFQSFPLDLEYIEIVDPLTLESLEDSWVKGAVACIVARAGEIRLIDNMEFISNEG